MNISQHCFVPLFPLLKGTYGTNGVLLPSSVNLTSQPMKSFGSNLWFSFRGNLNDEVNNTDTRVRLGVYSSIPGERRFTILTDGPGNFVFPVDIRKGDYYVFNNYHDSEGSTADSDKLFFKTVRDLLVMVPESSLPVQLNRLSLGNTFSSDVINDEEIHG